MVRYVPTGSIRLGDKRAGATSAAKVEALRQAIESGRKVPAIKVKPDGTIRDGRHRYLAFVAAGIPVIPVR